MTTHLAETYNYISSYIVDIGFNYHIK